jgi:hypothetical protein
MNPFYNFQSYPNTYYTKFRGTPLKLPLWHQKMDCLMCNYPWLHEPKVVLPNMLKLHQGLMWKNDLLKYMSSNFMLDSNPIPKRIKVPLQHEEIASLVQHICLIKAIANGPHKLRWP